MGTRSGDVDPSVVDFIAAKEGLSARRGGGSAKQAIRFARHMRISRESCDKKSGSCEKLKNGERDGGFGRTWMLMLRRVRTAR